MNIAIIPARGGSKRIPRKNIRAFHGRPILAYSIEAALASGLFEHVFVSTEDREISKIAEGLGAKWWPRSPELADDVAGTQEVMQNVLQGLLANEFSIDLACCIYATAPMLQPQDLDRGLQALRRRGGHFAFSIGTEPFLHDAGQFYWGTVAAFVNTEPVWAEDSVMVPLPANRVCDINTEADWKLAEQMYRALVEVTPARRQGWGR